MEESEAERVGQVWRPESHPGLWLYRAQGRLLSECPHSHEELQLTLDSGHVQELLSGGRHRTALPGSLVVVPPGEVHMIRSEGGRPGLVYGMLIPVAMLVAQVGLGALSGEGPVPMDAVLDAPPLAQAFVSLHRALRGPGARSALDARLRSFLESLRDSLAEGEPPRRRGGLFAASGPG